MWVGGVYSSGRTLEARRVAGSWAENTVAWSTQPLSVVNGLATATSGVGPIIFDVTALVAVMYSGTTNQGFLIRDSVENGATPYVQAFYSREAGVNPPTLTITYG